MSKSTTRNFEALEENRKAKLTAKQYMVYSYLISLSKWNAKDKEDHYYVYKNSFDYNEACEKIGIDTNTWRNALRKLYEEGYISYKGEWFTNKSGKTYYKESPKNEKYIIFIKQPYAPLDIKLIQHLVDLGTELNKIMDVDCGGNVVSVYSFLWYYWQRQDDCHINVSELMAIYGKNRENEKYKFYHYLLGYFHTTGLMNLSIITRLNAFNKPYLDYKINCVNTSLTDSLNNEGDIRIQDILEAISSDEFNLLKIEKI